MRYSQTTGNFYPDDIEYKEEDIPSDAISVTPEQFQAAITRGMHDTLEVVNGEVTVVVYTGPTLEEAQFAQVAILNSAYQTAITAPVQFTTAAGVTAVFPQTDSAKAYLNQILVTNQTSKTWSLNLWLDVTGKPVSPFTYTDLQNLASAMEAIETPDFTKLLTLIAQVQAETTVEGVQAVAWS